jgi:hypothetical protein
MGLINKALSAPSAYAAKKTPIWSDIMDMIDGCMFIDKLDEVREQIELMSDQFPPHWMEQVENQLILRREEILAEDIRGIMLDRYDF